MSHDLVTGMPVSAPLQTWRVNQAPPFTYTGVDYTGEILIRGQNGSEKVYVCLFTCAVTRAVHLELVHDLSAREFILAFRRFVGRRSLPMKIFSDNAKCFIAAGNELKHIFNDRDVMDYLTNHNVQWSFIPKRAPCHGGMWERLVGLVKSTMRKVLGKSFIGETELATLLSKWRQS